MKYIRRPRAGRARPKVALLWQTEAQMNEWSSRLLLCATVGMKMIYSVALRHPIRGYRSRPAQVATVLDLLRGPRDPVIFSIISWNSD